MAAGFAIRRVTLDPVTWTALVAPIDCSNINIRNRDSGASILIRSDPDDPSTEDTIEPLMQQTLAIPFHRYRFPAGSATVYLKTTAGTGPAIVHFLS